MTSKSEVINHGVESVGKRLKDGDGNFEPQIQQIAIDRLAVPISHPRKSPGDLESLQQSISRDGFETRHAATGSVLKFRRGHNFGHNCRF
jgi:hypothetical protein